MISRAASLGATKGNEDRHEPVDLVHDTVAEANIEGFANEIGEGQELLLLFIAKAVLGAVHRFVDAVREFINR